MKFKLSKFIDGLQEFKTEVPIEDSQKKSPSTYVMNVVWNHYRTSRVEFSKFSVEDLERAIEEFQWIPTFEEFDEDDEPDDTSDHNPWSVYKHMEEIVGAFVTNENRKYICEDDFL